MHRHPLLASTAQQGMHAAGSVLTDPGVPFAAVLAVPATLMAMAHTYGAAGGPCVKLPAKLWQAAWGKLEQATPSSAGAVLPPWSPRQYQFLTHIQVQHQQISKHAPGGTHW
jgi:hypothetical protein